MAIGINWAAIWDEAIWDLSIWQGVNPTLVSAVIQANGTDIVLEFDAIVAFGSGGNGGYTPNLNGGAATMTYSSGSGTTSLTYTLSRAIDSTEIGSLAYVQPGDGTEHANDLDDVASFSGFSIQNNSTQVTLAPTLQSASIDETGDNIEFVFDKAVTIGAGGNGGWTINPSGGAATLTYASGDGSRTLVYSISRTIADTETGDVDYTQPGNGVEDTAGNDLATFIDFTFQFLADLTHNDPTNRHMRTTLRHKDSNDSHNALTLGHNE